MPKKYEVANGEGPFERWERLPTKPGERLQGLSRAAIYQLIDAGKIKSASIKQKGKLTGIRAIWLPSLMAYIESCIEQPRGAK